MAARGQAAKSASGASMSKYDVEVEARLKALEEAVKKLQTHEHPAPAAPAPVDSGNAGARLDKLIAVLEGVPEVADRFPKRDGVRKIDI